MLPIDPSRSLQTPTWTLAWLDEVGLHRRLFSSSLARLTNMLLVMRDVRLRGRDIEGIIKQWFAFVKPNFERNVNPQRQVAG